MRWSYRIATVAGIEVRIHVTFLLLLAFYGWMYFQDGGFPAAVSGLIFILALFLCVLLHEFGHAFAALAFGICTPDITLLPIGGVARLERMPASPWQELVIAVAGPAVNVVIAATLALALHRIPSLNDMMELDQAAGSVLGKLFFINVVLVAFNAIPAFPMDGGRVLRALLATQMRHSKATLIAARVGQGIAVCFALLSFTPWGGTMLLFIAAFVFMGAQQELAYAQVREAAETLKVRDTLITRFATLPPTATAGDLRNFLGIHPQPVFPVVDDLLQVSGLCRRDDLEQAAREWAPQMSIRSLIRPVPALRPEISAATALETMQACGEPVLPVVNSSGQIIGLALFAELVRLSKNPSLSPTL